MPIWGKEISFVSEWSPAAGGPTRRGLGCQQNSHRNTVRIKGKALTVYCLLKASNCP